MIAAIRVPLHDLGIVNEGGIVAGLLVFAPPAIWLVAVLRVRKESGIVERINQQTGLRWGLIFFLAGLGLLRPLLSIAGGYNALGGGPLGPPVVTAAVAALWVGIVVAAHAPNPFLTLTVAGVLYGVFAILLQQVG